MRRETGYRPFHVDGHLVRPVVCDRCKGTETLVVIEGGPVLVHHRNRYVGSSGWATCRKIWIVVPDPETGTLDLRQTTAGLASRDLGRAVRDWMKRRALK